MKHITKTITILNILFLLSPINATGKFSLYGFGPEDREKRLVGQVESYISNTRNVTVIGITNQVKQKINSSAKFKEKLELLKWFEESRHSKKTTGQEALPELKEHLLTEVSQALKDKIQDFGTRLRIYDWAQEQNIPSKTKAWLDILFKDLSELNIHDKKHLSARYKKLKFKPETSPRKDILKSIFNDTSANYFDREKACKELSSMGLRSIASELESTYAEAARARTIEETAAKLEEERLRELQRVETEQAQAMAAEAARVKAEEERIQAEELRIAAEIEAAKAREIEEETSDDEWEKVGDEEEN